jgi:tetratricopeptide (TPR) repeat protein
MTHQRWKRAFLLAVGLLLTLITTGCTTTGSMLAACSSYDAGDYRRAYEQTTVSGAPGPEAAYLAGLSAYQLGRHDDARRWLMTARRAGDADIAARSQAQLGLLAAQQGHFDRAAREFLTATRGLTGQNRANAFFFAAIAQQKLGRWSQASTNLYLARSTSTNAVFREKVDAQLAVTGWTIQVGAYASDVNAARVAHDLARHSHHMRLGPARKVRTTDHAGRSITLVQVGRFVLYDQAARARHTLGEQRAIIVATQ